MDPGELPRHLVDGLVEPLLDHLVETERKSSSHIRPCCRCATETRGCDARKLR